MKILITGGAGYVGSNVVRLLTESGHEVVVLDDLRQGHRDAVPDVPLVQGWHQRLPDGYEARG